jgi:hypothetical protein
MATAGSVVKAYKMVCEPCGFTTHDVRLMENHNCETQQRGGLCEDYPCCGHEFGDCNGELYGSDEAIKEDVRAHINCDHENGQYECEGLGDEDEELDYDHDYLEG